jgi:hypothetical protein
LWNPNGIVHPSYGRPTKDWRDSENRYLQSGNFISERSPSQLQVGHAFVVLVRYPLTKHPIVSLEVIR